MKRRNVLAIGAGAAVVASAALFAPSLISRRKKLRIAGSVYVGWMPWYLADEDGTLERRAAEQGLEIEFVRADYADSIGFFGGGGVDAIVMTNVDAAASLASTNLEADCVLVGSFSNGNDAIVFRNPGVGSLVDTKIGLVQFSVSHYLLDRIAEKSNTDFAAFDTINVSDSAMISAFLDQSGQLDGVVTWNPIVDELQGRYGGQILADSTEIPREIADMLVVNRATLGETPQFATALLNTWFDITQRLKSTPTETSEMLGNLSGTDAEGYKRQLAKTELITDSTQAIAALFAPELQDAAPLTEQFALRHGLVASAPANWIGFGADQTSLLRFNPQPLLSI